MSTGIYKRTKPAWNKGTKGFTNKGSFKKGHKINLGRKFSQATKDKMSRSRIKADYTGEKHPCWKGGKVISGDGYIYIYQPNHPYKNNCSYVFEHRLVMEKYLGRRLNPKEVVHHINENCSDNRIKNLMLFPHQNAHKNYHLKLM